MDKIQNVDNVRLISVFSAVSTFPWLMVARSLQGVASACIAVAGMGMIAHLYDNEKERSKVGHWEILGFKIYSIVLQISQIDLST